MNAIFYVLKTGCQWRYLPKDYPPWQSAHRYFTKLHNQFLFEKINAVLVKKVRTQENRDPSPSLVCIDSQSIKADSNVDQRGVDGNKKINGRKRHIVTDVLGLILFCAVTAANVADIHPGRAFLKELQKISRIKKVLVDQGYQGMDGNHGDLLVEVSSKKPDQKGFIPQHKRWVVERTNAWISRQRRLAKDYEFRSDHQESMIFVGMIGIMLRRLA